jgi:hypothetical protein
MFFPKKRKTQLAIFVTALVAFFPGTYMAHGVTTTNLSFVVNPYTGGLLISVPIAADLGSTASPETAISVTGQLESVTVTDTRRGGPLRLWTAFAISTDLITGSDSLTATTIGYAAGTPTILSGMVGITEHTQTDLHTSVEVQKGQSSTGNHVVSWRPKLSIGLKYQQAAGTYVGVLTHSVS